MMLHCYVECSNSDIDKGKAFLIPYAKFQCNRIISSGAASDIPCGCNNMVVKQHRGCENISRGCKAAPCLTNSYSLLSCGADNRVLCCSSFTSPVCGLSICLLC